MARPMAPALDRSGEAPGDRADPDRSGSSPLLVPPLFPPLVPPLFPPLFRGRNHENPYQKYGDRPPEGVYTFCRWLPTLSRSPSRLS